MNDLKMAEDFLVIMESAPVKLTIETLKTLASFSQPFAPPVMEAGYQGLINLLKQYKQIKLGTLLEGINNRRGNDTPIDLDIIKTVELFQTIKAVETTTSLEKIRFIGKLYSGYALIEEEEDTDVYEEMLRAVNSLSYRQIRMLVDLKDIEDAFFPDGVQPGSANNNYYEKFLACCQNYGMDKETVDSLMESAKKTGFCRQYVGGYTGALGGNFVTTNYFSKVVRYAEDIIVNAKNG